MAVEIEKGISATLTFDPPLRGSSGSVSLLSPLGSPLASATATLDDLDLAITAVGTTPDVLTFASVTGLVPAKTYWLASTGWGARVRIGSIVGTTVTLESPPPGLPAIGDRLRGLTFSASITAPSTPGLNHRLVWTIDGKAYVEAAHVCVYRFRDPVTAEDASRLASAWHPSWARSQNYGVWTALAEKASKRVRQILTTNEDYPHRVGDHSAFTTPGETALRIELAYLGRIPNGFETATYIDEQERFLKAQCREAIAGTWVDRNDNNTAEKAEIRSIRNLTIERV